jgi:type II secretory pathway pseudopilin PulG
MSPLVSPFSPVRRSMSNGFTLLEMIIALAVFIFLCASVFGLMSSVLESTAGLQDNQNHSDLTERFHAFLDRKLKGLPAQSTVISYQRTQGGTNQDGIIVGYNENLIAIDAKAQPNGYYTLRFASFDSSTMPANMASSPALFFETNIIQDTGIAWTPLIRDVSQFSWKFQSLNAADWVYLWSDPANPPNLVEFSFQQAGDLQPSTMDFWLPHMVAIRIMQATQSGPTSLH